MSGPLTKDDLAAAWTAAVDDSFSKPLIAAGEGNGFEAYTQAFVQQARISLAIDTTTQAMFILPHSSQTGEPASGPRYAAVDLTFTRTRFIEKPIVITAGSVLFEEHQTDWGVDGGVDVTTGRRFRLVSDLVFPSGEAGPITAPAVAEFAGYSYNNVRPGAINRFAQPASSFYNDRATVIVTPGAATPTQPPPNASYTVLTEDVPDMFVPEHVGQIMLFASGANVGKMGRIVGFLAPALPAGSAAIVEGLANIEASTFAGAFGIKETITIKSGVTVVGFGAFLGSRDAGSKRRIVFTLLSGTVSVGNTLTGLQTGATATVESIQSDGVFAAEAPPVTGPGGAGWRILDWAVDLGFVVTNALQPSGGKSPMLDAHGEDRNLPRAPGESDATYRKRISTVADVVSPNAIRRALNRVMGAYPWCFREVGSALLPGFYYDGDGSGFVATPHGAVNDAYDTDTLMWSGALTSGSFVEGEFVELRGADTSLKARGYFGGIAAGVFTMIRKFGSDALAAGDTIVGLTSGAVFTPAAVVAVPTNVQRRFHVYLDYVEFRAFFMVGVPRVGFGEFGFAYDMATSTGFYDSVAPWNSFYDGFPAGAAAFYAKIWKAIDAVKAGGVGFELYIEDNACA